MIEGNGWHIIGRLYIYIYIDRSLSVQRQSGSMLKLDFRPYLDPGQMKEKEVEEEKKA